MVCWWKKKKVFLFLSVNQELFTNSHESNTLNTGEAYCKTYTGNWKVGHQSECGSVPAPNPSVKEGLSVTVTGSIKGQINETQSVLIQAIVQSFIAKNLKIDPSHVSVSISTTPGKEGFTDFTVKVSIDSASGLTQDSFNSGVNSIVSSGVEDSIESQGIEVQSGSVNINSGAQNPNFVEKMIVSLFLSFFVLLI